MTQYTRLRQAGGVYFFTVVTYKRRRILTDDLARLSLRQAMDLTAESRPYTTDAICLLPDHIHCVWTLPEDDDDFSTRWASIKSRFSKLYLLAGGMESEQSLSRADKREKGIWQRRFWEHAIRDSEDYRRHVDYVHFNPVKHGLARSPADWKWSSFHRHVVEGTYEPDWGSTEPIGCEEIYARAE